MPPATKKINKYMQFCKDTRETTCWQKYKCNMINATVQGKVLGRLYKAGATCSDNAIATALRDLGIETTCGGY